MDESLFSFGKHTVARPQGERVPMTTEGYDNSYSFEIPLWIMQRDELDPHAKLVYAALYTLAQGSFELIVETDYEYLSKVLGYKKTRTRNWFWKLYELELIDIAHFADREASFFRLRPHPWMEADLVADIPEEPAASTKPKRHLSLVP